MASVLKKRKRDEESKTPRKKSKGNLKRAMLLSSRGEMKAVDASSTSLNIAFSTSAAKALLNGTVPGNAIQNRLGRRMRMESIQVQGAVLQVQNGAGPGNDFLNLYLVYDEQPNGAAFAFSDLIQSCDNSGTTGSTVFGFMNMSNSKRFRILRHWKKKIGCPAGVSANQPAQEGTDYVTTTTINWFLKLKGLDVQYNTGTAGTIADIQTGALYLMAVGANASADSQYSLAFNARLRFHDL